MRRARLLLIALGIPTLLAHGALVLAQWRSGAALAQFRALQKAYPPDSQKATPPAVLDRKLAALARASRMAPADPEPAYQLALLKLVGAEARSLAPQGSALPLESGPDPGLTRLLQEGLRAIRRAIAFNPGAAEYHFVAALLLQNLAGAAPDHPQGPDASPAILAHLENSDRLDPYRSSLHSRIGSFHLALGNREQAKHAFSVALEQKPEKAKDIFGALWSFSSSPGEIRSFVDHQPRVCVLLAEFLTEHGFRDEAGVEYEDATKGENDFEVAKGLIRKYIREKDHDRVLALVQRIEGTMENREASRRAFLLYAAGQAHFNKGDFESAVRNFETALRIDESELFVHHNLALAFLKQKRYSKAIARWQYLMNREDGRTQLGKAIEIVHLGLAQAYEGEGRIQEALAEYLEASRINPTNNFTTAKITEISHRL